ncbi:glycosyltransferase [Ensifer sp. HO-A22]|jgi:cellulose synthase (UDP-forming)|uniref:Glycosyltransferase n=1 Tax=Ensifer oleiphilus TaxID=2742698 RepID=A0A7Y6Q737_9HYPH|nr:cellulose synthase catalytic subunit [Ensifer oleiphilus]NVD40287.1 glycosyltransferase [Ensifer oleiphilus]
MFFHLDSDLTSVLLFDLGVALAFLALAALADPRNPVERVAFSIVTATSLALYLCWRLLDTLPDLEPTAESLWPYVYFSFEAISIVYAVASVLILCRTTDWTAEADAAESELAASGRYPSVAVFICTYNEPIHILEKSAVCAKAMDYPDFQVYVCDDTRRPEVREYCETIGVNYITRPDNRHAKAGNLNNALQLTNKERASDFIMVLDADFAPQANFLKRVVGLFRSQRIGIVQTPQFYFNADPIQHNLHIASSFVDDQRVFFDTFQPAKDAVECAFCVGTSFVVRRDLVNEIGGFPHEALSEDMLLSYRLMERGYVTRWLNEKLSVGLSAEGIPEYITQRTRWCLGTIQIGLLKDGPLWRGHFTLRQRFHYLHGLLCWLSKPFILCLLFAPSIYWLFGISALQADELLFMKYGISSLLVFWVYASWISGKRTLPLFTEVTHALTALPVTLTLLQAIRRPFGRPFKVTEKGGDRARMRVHLPTALFFGLVTVLSGLSVLQTVLAWSAPTDFSEREILNLVWSLVSMTIAFVSLLVCIELPRYGQEEVIDVSLDGQYRQAGHTVDVRIGGLSADRVRIPGLDPARTDNAAVYLPQIGWVRIAEIHDAGGGLTILPTTEQRNGILRLLFGVSRAQIADHGSLRASMAGLLRRAFIG